jgi:hypothetical protein
MRLACSIRVPHHIDAVHSAAEPKANPQGSLPLRLISQLRHVFVIKEGSDSWKHDDGSRKSRGRAIGLSDPYAENSVRGVSVGPVLLFASKPVQFCRSGRSSLLSLEALEEL